MNRINWNPQSVICIIWVCFGHSHYSWLSILCCQVPHSATMINSPPNILIPPNNVIVLYSPLGNGDNEWLHKQEGLLITGTGVVSNWKALSTNFNWLKIRVRGEDGRNSLYFLQAYFFSLGELSPEDISSEKKGTQK